MLNKDVMMDSDIQTTIVLPTEDWELPIDWGNEAEEGSVEQILNQGSGPFSYSYKIVCLVSHLSHLVREHNDSLYFSTEQERLYHNASPTASPKVQKHVFQQERSKPNTVSPTVSRLLEISGSPSLTRETQVGRTLVKQPSSPLFYQQRQPSIETEPKPSVSVSLPESFYPVYLGDEPTVQSVRVHMRFVANGNPVALSSDQRAILQGLVAKAEELSSNGSLVILSRTNLYKRYPRQWIDTILPDLIYLLQPRLTRRYSLKYTAGSITCILNDHLLEAGIDPNVTDEQHFEMNWANRSQVYYDWLTILNYLTNCLDVRIKWFFDQGLTASLTDEQAAAYGFEQVCTCSSSIRHTYWTASWIDKPFVMTIKKSYGSIYSFITWLVDRDTVQLITQQRLPHLWMMRNNYFKIEVGMNHCLRHAIAYALKFPIEHKEGEKRQPIKQFYFHNKYLYVPFETIDELEGYIMDVTYAHVLLSNYDMEVDVVSRRMAQRDQKQNRQQDESFNYITYMELSSQLPFKESSVALVE